MAKKICILALITILFSLSSPWIDPAVASLPNGNRLKDPYAILRNSLPIDQKELRELQNKLEDTSDDLRGSRWSAISKATSRSQFLVTNRKNQILDSIPEENKEKAKFLYNKEFVRMWEFYLASCSAAFKFRDLVVYQLQLVKNFTAPPSNRRNYIYQ